MLDVEAFTAARPETFFHEHSNHFFCVCPHSARPDKGAGSVVRRPGADVRVRCQDPTCDGAARSTPFDNGEPNRWLAQMVLHALCVAGNGTLGPRPPPPPPPDPPDADYVPPAPPGAAPPRPVPPAKKAPNLWWLT